FLDFGSKFKNPNFAAMADAVGVRGMRLEDPGDVERGIAEALAHDGPVLVDAVVSRMMLPIPPSITVDMAKGFTLYMLKAVMGGRGDDLIDLAKANSGSNTRSSRRSATACSGEGQLDGEPLLAVEHPVHIAVPLTRPWSEANSHGR